MYALDAHLAGIRAAADAALDELAALTGPYVAVLARLRDRATAGPDALAALRAEELRLKVALPLPERARCEDAELTCGTHKPAFFCPAVLSSAQGPWEAQCARIQEILFGPATALPPALADTITAAHATLTAGGGALAVRSSATVEDAEVRAPQAGDEGWKRGRGQWRRKGGCRPEQEGSPRLRRWVIVAAQKPSQNCAYRRVGGRGSAWGAQGASSAGMYESVLGVHTAAECAAAVRRCWASMYAPRAVLYRAQNGRDGRCGSKEKKGRASEARERAE